MIPQEKATLSVKNKTQIMNKTTTNKLICSGCAYSGNPPQSKNCEVCGTVLESTPGNRSLANHHKTSLSLRQQEANSEVRRELNAFNHRTVSTRLTWQIFWIVALANLLTAIILGGSYLLWRDWNRLNLSESQQAEIAGNSEIQLKDSPVQFYQTMEEVPNVPAGLFNYGGATCFAALTKYGMNEAIASAHPKYLLRYTEPLNSKPGCSTGIEMLLDSELSFAQNGRPLQESEYTKANSRNLTLKQIPVAIDGIVFFVHPSLPIKGLSINQLKDIFQGKITNWQQVGGLDLPVVAISQDPKVHITINSLLKNGEQLGEEVKIVRDYTAAMREVGNTPGSISYSSAAIARGQKTIKGIGLASSDSTNYVPPFTGDGKVNLKAFRNDSYPLTRRLFVVVREDGTIEEIAGIAYANLLLTDEGQQIVEKAGFVPLYE